MYTDIFLDFKEDQSNDSDRILTPRWRSKEVV